MRIDLLHIADLVEANDRVLDLGCGSGELLAYLNEQKNVRGYGVEKDNESIEACIERGVNVIEHDLNAGLDRFPDDSFDIIVMLETLQALESPRKLFQQLLRIARRCVVSFPNFGHWRCRYQLLTKGRMPIADHLPHQWYDTPNIHLCTFRDFDDLCRKENYSVVESLVMDADHRRLKKKRFSSNLFGETGFYILERSS